jgi:hypothetical protein
VAGARLSLWGRVVDGGGTPLPGAELFWVDDEHARGATAALLHVHKVGQADAEGRFWASGLPEGPGVLVPDFQRIGVGEDQVRLDRGTRLTLPMAEGSDDLVLRFPVTPKDFARILGTVYDTVDGTPVAGHPLVLVDVEGGRKFKREADTGADGSFQFPWLPPGKFLLAVMGTHRYLTGAMPAEVAAGKKVEARIGLHRRPEGPRHAVRVRVEGPLGLPVPGAKVILRAENYATPALECGPDGSVEATGYAVRPSAVLASAPGYFMGAAAVPPEDPGGAVEVTVSLLEVARIRVSPRDAATGAPLRYANLFVKAGGAEHWWWGGVLPPPGAPAPDFTEFAVPPGPVAIHADSPGYREARRVVEVPPGDDPTLVTVPLEPRQASPPHP